MSNTQKYHSIVAVTCPYAHRSIIARTLFKVEDQVSQSEASPIKKDGKWAFQDLDEYHTPAKDSLFPDATYVADVYSQAPPPNWDKVNSVPLLVDAQTKKSVTNTSAETIYLFADLPGAKIPENFDLGPRADSDAIKQIQASYLQPLLLGFRAVGSKTQQEYDEVASKILATFDSLESLLNKQKFLLGNKPSGADLILWPFYVRWDVLFAPFARVYVSHRISYPNITRWIRDIAALGEGSVGKTFKQYAASLSMSGGLMGIGLFPNVDQKIIVKLDPWEFSDVEKH